MKKATDNKHFWKAIKSNLTYKILKDEQIILVQDDNVITAETDLAKIFNDHFENIVVSLQIERLCKANLDRKLLVNAIKNLSQHPSILKIKGNETSSACFSFHAISNEDLLF